MYSVPIAYFITFPCYGTWLHGDARGSVDREHNVFGTPFLPPDALLEMQRRVLMKHPEVHLDAQQRLVVEEAVSETCFYRNWTLHASTARSNHVHVVLGAGNAIAETVLNALKANATRLMREQGCWPIKYSPWSTGGSTRYVWKSEELADVINYVLNCQD